MAAKKRNARQRRLDAPRETKTFARLEPTQVYYQTSVQVAPFKHKHCGAMMQVNPGENGSEALERCARWVHAQLGIPADVKPAATAVLRRMTDE